MRRNHHLTLIGPVAALLFGALVMPAFPAEFQRVSFTSANKQAITLTGFVFRPAGTGPFPAVVALHGCGGLGAASRELSKRHDDWAGRLVRAGYVVLMPDSFAPRGAKSLCGTRDRVVRPSKRADDARGAAAWLAVQPFVQPGRIGVLGWSNGGSTVLHLVGRDGVSAAFTAAVAFYPGCRVLLKKADWTARIPLLIQHGAADDWTPIAPCRELAGKSSKVRLIAYPGAFHDF